MDQCKTPADLDSVEFARATQSASTHRPLCSTPDETICCSSAADSEGILREMAGIFRSSVRGVGTGGSGLRNSENGALADSSVTLCQQALTKKPGALGCRAGVLLCGPVFPTGGKVGVVNRT